MKKIIMIALMSTFAMSGFMNQEDIKEIKAAEENARLCEVFKGKVKTYESTMRNDGLAEATLISYRKRMSAYCNNTTVEKPNTVNVELKTVETAKAEIKTLNSLEENARLCNIFTDKVKIYESSMRNDGLAEATLESYKQRQSAFCKASRKS
jgi:hypothetical protein